MPLLSTITGNNLYACRQKLRSIKDDFMRKNGDFSVEQIDCGQTNFAELKATVQSPGLLSPNKLIVFENASANKDLVNDFEQLVAEVPSSTELVIYDSNLDRRTAFYKFLKKQPGFNDFSELDKPALVGWILDYVKQEGGSIGRAEAGYLIDRLGTNQQIIKNELDKLLLYEPKISKENIDQLTSASPQSSIFDLIDAAFAGNLKKANILYDEQRALKVEPQNIIAMITWQLHVLGLVKTAGNKTPAEIAKEAKISPYVVSKSEPIAKKMTFNKLRALVSELANLDYISKNMTLDLDEGLKNYLVKLSA